MTELPYFKFYIGEWVTGDIAMEDMETQGLFINICALYWSRGCELTMTLAKRRFRTCKEPSFNSLVEFKIIKLNGDNITINFLDEQFEQYRELSEKNKKNGSKGGRPLKNKKPKENPEETQEKPNGFVSLTQDEPKKSNIEKIIEEKKIEENSNNKNDDALPSFIDLNRLEAKLYTSKDKLGKKETFIAMALDNKIKEHFSRNGFKDEQKNYAILADFVCFCDESDDLPRDIYESKKHFFNWLKAKASDFRESNAMAEQEDKYVYYTSQASPIPARTTKENWPLLVENGKGGGYIFKQVPRPANYLERWPK